MKKTTLWQAFLWSASVWTTSQGTKRQNCGLECKNGGERDWSEETTLDGNGPVAETGPVTDGSRKCNMNVVSAIKERAHSWAGHVARMDHKDICAKAFRCRGLQWWRWTQLHWKELEKDKWSGPHPQRFKIYRWEIMADGGVQIHCKCRRFVGNCPGQHGLVASCSKPWKLKTVFEIWREPCVDGPGCLGDPCGMTGKNAGAA